MSNYCGFAFIVTILVIITSIDSKSAVGAEFIFSQQLLAQSSLQKTNTGEAFNTEPIIPVIKEQISESQNSSDDSEFNKLFTPILCTLLGYFAGSVVGSKNQRERVKERIPKKN